MNYYNEDTIIYVNGDFVKASEAKMDFFSQSLHYGYAVFEGIRSYRTVTGDARIFEEKAHYERLKRSAELMKMPYEYSTEKLIEATYTLLDLNNIKDAYIRPLIYAPANMSFVPNTESYIMIAAWEMSPFLGEKLLRVMTSTFQRPNPKSCHIEAKASGHYVNSLLASHEAKANGYDEALLTDMNGFVAEAPGANMFMELDGVLYTPPLGNILPGITRATVINICEDLNIPVEEKFFTVDELRNADAAFFCGTAAEVIGWDSLDGVAFLKPWHESAGKIVQDAYKNKVIESGHKKSKTSREGVTV